MDDEDVAQLVQKIADTVKGLCVKLGYLNESGEIVQNPALDPLFQEDSALYQATVHSIAGKIAFGPNTGQYVRRLGQGFGYDEEVPHGASRSTAFLSMPTLPSTPTHETASAVWSNTSQEVLPPMNASPSDQTVT